MDDVLSSDVMKGLLICNIVIHNKINNKINNINNNINSNY